MIFPLWEALRKVIDLTACCYSSWENGGIWLDLLIFRLEYPSVHLIISPSFCKPEFRH